jgi:glycosyl transferase family 2
MPRTVPDQIHLSVVVATTHAWPFLKPCFDILLPQCEALGAELLIGDSTGEGLPCPLPESCSRIRHIVLPGASVFDLQAKATSEAAGEIVAWTEDHCLPAPDWCEKIREAHERNPDAEMVGGAVVNGSRDNPMDWANFLCTFGPFVPPIKRPPGQRVPAVANLSMKRRAIPSGPIRAGFVEIVCEARLLLAGRVRFDDRIQVTHVQSWGFWGTFAAHFHNGRSTNGLLADTMPAWKRFHQTMICFLMPAGLMWTSVTPLLGKARVPWARHLPFMFALAVVFSVGGFVGVAGKGAGRSPHFLE